ncbi:MAG: Glucose-6-phosphate isomerase [Parcubacteria group bacterium GW2011_GWA2_51_12]|nr:MAG: Glucose-6-phosphate isomerase [Parcubacteria group bacterium GW2011_GWA2_51_12]
MLAIEKTSGLPIALREDFSLEFGPGLRPSSVEVTDQAHLKTYLKDPIARASRRDIYSRHTDLALTGTSVTYPQLFEVLVGEVFFILQRPSADPGRLEELYLFSLRHGEKLIVPPGFGVTAVNPGKEVLVTGCWQAAQNQEQSEQYEIENGAGYYVIESGRLSREGETKKNFEFVPNLNYKYLPKLIESQVRELPRFDLRVALPMYFTGTKDPRTLDFLVNPENYPDDLIPGKLFILPQYEKSGY